MNIVQVYEFFFTFPHQSVFKILHAFFHRLCRDKLIHNANLKFFHLIVLMICKIIGNFNKKYANLKTSN